VIYTRNDRSGFPYFDIAGWYLEIAKVFFSKIRASSGKTRWRDYCSWIQETSLPLYRNYGHWIRIRGHFLENLLQRQIGQAL